MSMALTDAFLITDNIARRAALDADAEAIARVRAGDTDAFEPIIRRHNQRLFRVARSILRDDDDAQDALQDAYIKAFSRLHTFHGPPGFATWLARIVSNEALMRLRQRRRTVTMSEYDDTHETPLEPAEHAGRGPDALTASGELGAVLETAIDTLPIQFRTVFMLRGVEQMSIAEVADVLGIPPATVKTRHHRAKAMLRDRLYRKLDMAAPRAFEFAGARCDRVTAAVMQRLRADR